MKARQAKKILSYFNERTPHKRSDYWLGPLLHYFLLISLDHRISKALKVYQRHGRVHHPLSPR